MKSKLKPGEALQEVRIHLDLSQKELAETLGINQATISKIEQGEQGIGNKNAEKLANYLIENNHLAIEDKDAFKRDLIKGWNATRLLRSEPQPAILLDHKNIEYLDQYLPQHKFVGRAAEIALIKQYIDNNQRLFVEGFPAIGKTTLVAEFVRDYLVNELSNSVIWLEAGRETDTRLLRALAKPIDRKNALGSIGDASLIHFIREQIEKHKVSLVVLEDFWGSNSFDEPAALNVLQVIPPNVAVIVTSRNLNRIPGTQRIRLGSLDTQAACELLNQYSDNLLSAPDNFQAKKLCEAVDNHPFAIKLVGGFLRQNPDLDFEWIYDFAKQRLHELVDSDGQRRLDINFLIDQSLKRLNQGARNIFLACGALNSRRLPLELLNYFLVRQGNLDMRPSKYKPLDLVHLRNANLVERTEDKDNRSYIVLHQLALSYARNKSDQIPDNRFIAIASCQDYVTDNANNFSALHAARESLFAAGLDLAAQPEQTSNFIDYMWNFVKAPAYVDSKGYTPTGLEALEKAAWRAEEHERWKEAHYMWAKVGNAYAGFLIDYAEAELAYKKAAELAPKLATQDEWEAIRREAISESLVGTVYFRQGKAAQADEQFDKAEEIARDNSLVLSQIYEHRGHKEVWCYQDYEKAQEYFLTSLDYVNQIEDEGVRIGRRFWSLINLSGIANVREHFFEAIGYACAVRQIARALKNDVLLAYALNELGEQYLALGKMRLARSAFCRAKALFIEVGDEEWTRKLQLFMEQHDLQCDSE